MRFHTLALVATLGNIANTRPSSGRYEYTAAARFEKSYDNSPTIYRSRIYTLSFNFSPADSQDWTIERIVTESADYRATHFPRLKKFEFSPGRATSIAIQPDDRDELGVDITLYNDHRIIASYQTMFGSGSCEGRYTDPFDQVKMTDRGPSHKQQHATTTAEFQFTNIKKL